MEDATAAIDFNFERHSMISRKLKTAATINGDLEVRFGSVFKLIAALLCVEPGSTETSAL